MFGFGLVGLLAVLGYLYVVVAIWRAAAKSGDSHWVAATKAVVWPITIWPVIEALYKKYPD